MFLKSSGEALDLLDKIFVLFLAPTKKMPILHHRVLQYYSDRSLLKFRLCSDDVLYKFTHPPKPSLIFLYL